MLCSGWISITIKSNAVRCRRDRPCHVEGSDDHILIHEHLPSSLSNRAKMLLSRISPTGIDLIRLSICDDISMSEFVVGIASSSDSLSLEGLKVCVPIFTGDYMRDVILFHLQLSLTLNPNLAVGF